MSRGRSGLTGEWLEMLKSYSMKELAKRVLDLLELRDGDEFEIHKLRDGSIRLVRKVSGANAS